MIARWFVVAMLCLSMVVLRETNAAVAGGGPVTATVASGRLPAWTVLVAAGRATGLSHPEGLAIDYRGQSVDKWMYLADTSTNRIIRLGTGGRYLGSWGSSGTRPGEFRRPTGVAVDGHGDVYVADTGNNRVEIFGPEGRFLSQWGTAGTGPGQFSAPAAVAIGGSGNVFVADRNNNRIEKFSPAGRLLAVWPISLPTSTNPPGLGPRGPDLLTVDSRGSVFAAIDTGQCSGGHCVMDYIALETLSSSGKVIRTVVGGNPYGPFSYQPIPGVSLQGPWWQIGALTSDKHGDLFLAVWDSQNQSAVIEISTTAKQIGRWELPKPSGAKGWPGQGIALDPRGNVYVADTLANRVLKLVFRP